jgi:DNA-binding CsgD family transcriptional regulator/PAS domain-containing protein
VQYTAQGATSPLDRQIPGLDEIADSYDEDLGWILDQFLQRVGASGTAISIHDRSAHDGTAHGGASTGRILLIRGERPLSEADGDALTAAAQGCAQSHLPPAERCRTVERDLGGQPRALFSLWVSADEHCDVVLTVIYPPDAASAPLIPAVCAKFQPVLGGYFKLWLLTRAYRRRMTALRAALDHTDLGIYLIDRKGQMLLSNAAGQAILDEEDGLYRSGAYLRASDPAAERRLRLLIAEPGPVPTKLPPVVALPRGGERRPLLLSVMPIRRAPADTADASAVIYVFNPDLDVRALLAPVAQTYRLSPAEARLLALIANGDSVAEAASELNVKEQTVRAYLKNIFVKTGTTRQADLVRVVLTSLVRLHVGGARLSSALIASTAVLFGMEMVS